MNKNEAANTVSPGVRYCGHHNSRVVQTWPNGVQTGACNVCNQTHIWPSNI